MGAHSQVCDCSGSHLCPVIPLSALASENTLPLQSRRCLCCRTHCVRRGARSGRWGSGRCPSPRRRCRCAGRRSGAGSWHRTGPAGILQGDTVAEPVSRQGADTSPILRFGTWYSRTGTGGENRNWAQYETTLRATVTGPVQDNASKSGLPNSQDFPVHPGAQEQEPSAASQSPPLWQEQVCWQPTPYRCFSQPVGHEEVTVGHEQVTVGTGTLGWFGQEDPSTGKDLRARKLVPLKTFSIPLPETPACPDVQPAANIDLARRWDQLFLGGTCSLQ